MKSVLVRNRASKLEPGTVAYSHHFLGHDPVTTLVDALCCYAEKQFKSGVQLCDDAYLGPAWLDAVQCAAMLLNGPGQFDGGTLDGALRDAAELSGFTRDFTAEGV